jgi:hypothetical protein
VQRKHAVLSFQLQYYFHSRGVILNTASRPPFETNRERTHQKEPCVFSGDGWVAMQSSIEYASGKRENSGVYIGKGALFSIIDKPDSKSIERNIEAINYFASQVNVPVSLMIVPSASEIQPEKLPDFAVTWSLRDTIADIYSQCDGVECVSVYETLKEHSDDYIYYRTDHHWTTYGAYLAYAEYCRARVLLPHDYVAETVSNSFNGTLYSKSGVRFIKSDTIEAY